MSRAIIQNRTKILKNTKNKIMRTFNLLATNDTQPKSILCLDNKKELVCTVWCDRTITVNGQDLTSEEMQQIMAISNNFWLFYNSIIRNPDDLHLLLWKSYKDLLNAAQYVFEKNAPEDLENIIGIKLLGKTIANVTGTIPS